MAKNREKRLKRIKREHGLISTIIYILLIAAVCGVFYLAGVMLIDNFIDSRYHAEYEDMKFATEAYEQMGGEYADRMLKLKGREYIISDANGNILYENGENTRSEKEGMLRFVGMPFASETVKVYGDTEKDFVFFYDNGSVGIRWKDAAERYLKDDGGSLFIGFSEEDHEDPEAAAEKLRESLLEDIGEVPGEDLSEDEDRPIIAQSIAGDMGDGLIESRIYMSDEDLMNEDLMDMPLWMEIALSDGSFFVGRAHLVIGWREFISCTMIAMVLVVLMLILVLVMIVNGIKKMKRQRDIQDFFYTDEATLGRNWLYYLIKGESFLKKRRNGGRRYAVVALDFIEYGNFCLCHSVKEGEELLRRITWGLRGLAGKKEICVHRDAGKFALLLETEGAAEAGARVEKMIADLSGIDPGHKCSFRAGIDIIEPCLRNGRPAKRKDLDLDQEFSNAQAAQDTLLGSTDSGVALFDDRLMDEQKWIASVTERQQRALDNEEFMVYYQPKYAPDTGELKGAEALIRWLSPEDGLVPPGRFIPIFEKNGFIVNIDHYMIGHVARQQKKWLDAGYKCVPVSVNVSRAHFIENDLAEQIRDMVDAEGTPHEYIEIELTESAFFDDKKALTQTIEKLKSYGFEVSMDDFGSGYSSLNSLKDLALDVLKLDAEFFRGGESDRGHIVVAEAIKLAKNLNMRVVAEGVEVKDQVEFLAGQGCDMIQGYYFAKPMPAGDYEKKMNAGKEKAAGEEAGA